MAFLFQKEKRQPVKKINKKLEQEIYKIGYVNGYRPSKKYSAIFGNIKAEYVHTIFKKHLSLMNIDTKILSRIVANRIQ